MLSHIIITKVIILLMLVWPKQGSRQLSLLVDVYFLSIGLFLLGYYKGYYSMASSILGPINDVDWFKLRSCQYGSMPGTWMELPQVSAMHDIMHVLITSGDEIKSGRYGVH